MKTKRISIVIMILLGITALSVAQEEEQPNKLGVTLDLTYASRYLWRGFNIYPKTRSALQPSIDIDLYGTGFGINIWGSIPNGSGFEDSKEIDYTAYYYNSFFKDEAFVTDYTVGWVYFHCPGLARDVYDLQEAFATFAWPKICPIGIVPSYTVSCIWPAVSNSGMSNTSGWFHILGLGYDVSLSPILSNTTEQVIHFSFETIYNDGAYGANVDHDWSHAVFGISTGFQFTENLTFTPGLYYQSSWDDSVNTSDECWISLSLSYTF